MAGGMIGAPAEALETVDVLGIAVDGPVIGNLVRLLLGGVPVVFGVMMVPAETLAAMPLIGGLGTPGGSLWKKDWGGVVVAAAVEGLAVDVLGYALAL